MHQNINPTQRAPRLARIPKIAVTPLLIAAAGWAVAQQDPASTPLDADETAESPSESLTLEAVEVTARRRVELLRDVPSSVSVFGSERVKDMQADQLNDIQHSVPNLYFEPGDGSNAVIFMRGIGQNDSLSFVDSGVAVYLDGVFIARSQAAFLDVFDVERIEVLRGPQGTLYGRNSPGGAIKFISSPAPHSLEANIEAGIGNFGEKVFKGRIGGPLLGDQVRGKLAVATRQHNGFANNSVLDSQDGDTESFAWRGGLDWTPTPELAFTLTADGRINRPDRTRSPIRMTEVFAFTDPLADPPEGTIFPPNDNSFVAETGVNDLNDLESYGFTLRADWWISPTWSLESITGYREMEFDLILDTDGAPLPLIDVALFQDQEQFSQELRLSYAGSRLNFTGGVFYFEDDDLTLSGFDAQSASIFGLPLIAFAPGAQLADTDQETESIAVFGHATIDVTPRLALELGLRYTRDEKTSARRFEVFPDPNLRITETFPEFLAGVGVAGPQFRGSEDWDAFTPRVSLSYEVNDDVMVYGSAARGFKSGGFDGRAASEFEFQPFDPETVWTYEGGLKSTLAGGRLAANVAVFYSDYQDLQVTSFGREADTGFFQTLFTNAAEAEIKGLELELAARPTRNLGVQASVGYLDAEYEEFETLVNGETADVSDRDLINSPNWNANLAANYTLALNGWLNLVFNGDISYRGEVANEITDSPILRQDEYVTLNATLALATASGRWELRAGARNLTDQNVIVQGFNLSEFPGVQTAFFGTRRSYDLRLFYNFQAQ